MRRVLGCLLAAAAISCPGQPIKSEDHHNNVLLLIQPSIAGPSVDPLTYWQPQWILWPPAGNPVAGGRLLSVLSGRDWRGRPDDYRFSATPGRIGWRASGFDKLVASGYFVSKRDNLGSTETRLLMGLHGAVTPNALRLALNSTGPEVFPCTLADKHWQEGNLMVGEASSWDEVAEVEHSTDGRVLVVEYPPREDAPWTRYWLRGSGWKQSGLIQANSEHAVSPTDPEVGVPGLIPARSLGRLLLRPGQFQRAVLTPNSFAGANRYLSLSHRTGWLLSILTVVLIGAVLTWCAGLAAHERTSLVAPKLLTAVLLSPSIIVLAGNLTRWGGPDAWAVWVSLSGFALLMVLAGMQAAQRRIAPRGHPLMSVSLVTLTTLGLGDPKWGLLSPLFAGRLDLLSYTAFGAFSCSAIGLVASVRGCGSRWVWGMRLGIGALLAIGWTLQPWWGLDRSALLFSGVAAILIGEQMMDARWLVVFALWPFSVYRCLVFGVAWAPMGLLSTLKTAGALNSARYIEFLMAPAAWVSAMVAVWCFVFGSKFLVHQFKRLIDTDPRRNALSFGGAAAGAFSVLNPEFLPAALTSLVAALAFLLWESIQPV